MQKNDYRRLANMLSKQHDKLKQIPGFLALRISGLETYEPTIDLQIKSEVFAKDFPPALSEISKSTDGTCYHARVDFGKVVISCVMREDEYKQYISEAKITA